MTTTMTTGTAALSAAEHARAVTRARAALRRLEADHAATRRQLGTARDHLNTVCNQRERDAVTEALAGIEAIANETGQLE